MNLVNIGEIDRRLYLGGSNAAAIIGVGAYGDTPLTCYLAKIGEGAEEADPKRELFLKRRKRWEGPIIEMLREEFDGAILTTGVRYRDSEFDFLAAEIDFEWRDADGAIQNGEIKTVSPFMFGSRQGWGEPGSADIPLHYAAQVMHGLGVTGRQTCIVAAMVGLDTMVFYRLERDEETIAAMRERMVSFWFAHVLERVPPDPVSLADVMQISLGMRGRPVEISDEIAERIEQLRQLRAKQKALEADEDQIKFEILDNLRAAWLSAGADIPDNAVLLRRGEKVASYGITVTSRLDSKRLKEEQPEIAATYSKSSSTRVLRLTKSK